MSERETILKWLRNRADHLEATLEAARNKRKEITRTAWYHRVQGQAIAHGSIIHGLERKEHSDPLFNR